MMSPRSTHAYKTFCRMHLHMNIPQFDVFWSVGDIGGRYNRKIIFTVNEGNFHKQLMDFLITNNFRERDGGNKELEARWVELYFKTLEPLSFDEVGITKWGNAHMKTVTLGWGEYKIDRLSVIGKVLVNDEY